MKYEGAWLMTVSPDAVSTEQKQIHLILSVYSYFRKGYQEHFGNA